MVKLLLAITRYKGAEFEIRGTPINFASWALWLLRKNSQRNSLHFLSRLETPFTIIKWMETWHPDGHETPLWLLSPFPWNLARVAMGTGGRMGRYLHLRSDWLRKMLHFDTDTDPTHCTFAVNPHRNRMRHVNDQHFNNYFKSNIWAVAINNWIWIFSKIIQRFSSTRCQVL